MSICIRIVKRECILKNEYCCLSSILHYLLQSFQKCLNGNCIQNGRQTGQVGRWIINIGRHQRHVQHFRFGKQDFDFAFFAFFGSVREEVVLFNGSFVFFDLVNSQNLRIFALQ